MYGASHQVMCDHLIVLFVILTCEYHFFCHLVIKKMNAISFPTSIFYMRKFNIF